MLSAVLLLPDYITAEAAHNDGLELPAETMRQLHEEARVMARMRHPNLVTFLGLCSIPPCIGGSLK